MRIILGCIDNENHSQLLLVAQLFSLSVAYRFTM